MPQLSRKQIIKSQELSKNTETGYTTTPILIKSDGKGKYYGLEVDKDKLFLLKDGTVVHNTLISFKGAEAKVLGISPQDIAYLELLRYGLKLISGQFGVPLYLIGFPETFNRASASEGRRSYYLTNIFQIRKILSQKITIELIKDSLHIEGWRFDFRSAGLEESEASRRDFMLGWTKGLYSFNEARIAMGLLPIEDEWANKYYLVGSKNDSLIPLEEAINNPSDTSADDTADIKPATKPGEPDPSQDGTPPSDAEPAPSV